MADQDYESLTVAKLRETFKERKIPATGLTKKAQLIEKLRQVDAEQEVPEAKPDGDDAESALQSKKGDAMESITEDEIAARENHEKARETPLAASGVSATPPVQRAEAKSMNGPESKETAEEPIVPNEQDQAQPSTEVALSVEPVSRQSPSPEGTADDSRKRKRRSPSPAVDEEAVAQKRQRQESEPAHTMKEAPVDDTNDERNGEDIVVADAPTLTPEDDLDAIATNAEELESRAKDSHEAAIEAKESMPEQEEKAAEAAAVAEESAQQADTAIAKGTEADFQRHARFRDLSDTLDRDVSVPQIQEDGEDREVEPSRHAATSALYIRNLKRPIRDVQLREHLQHLAASPSASALDVQVYLDSLRTHAFALFPSISHATRARTKLHNVVWPKERERDALFVDYIKEDQYHAFVQEEEAAIKAVGGRPSSMKRFEVGYFPSSDGEMQAELREQGAPGKGMPGAPTGPRRPSEPIAGHKRKISDMALDTPSFGALSKMFKCTQTKPKLYFQPVPQRLVDDRFDELKAKSSRRLLSDEVGGGSGLPDSRRYTFEERGWMEGRIVAEDGREPGAYGGSSRLCDNGPEFGLKVPIEFRRGRGGYRGGRGGRR